LAYRSGKKSFSTALPYLA